MALNNLANLKSAMKEWALDRPDLVPQFQDCIDMAINDANRVLRCRQQQAETLLTLDAEGSSALPPDYLEWRSVIAKTNPVTVLTPLTPEGEGDIYPNSYGGPPATFVIEDNKITVQPLSDAPIELKYWKKIPLLVEVPPGDTNWLLAENANLVLYGAMKYVETFKRNMNGVQLFGQLYSGEVDGMVRESKRSQWSRVRARVAGRSTP